MRKGAARGAEGRERERIGMVCWALRRARGRAREGDPNLRSAREGLAVGKRQRRLWFGPAREGFDPGRGGMGAKKRFEFWMREEKNLLSAPSSTSDKA